MARERNQKHGLLWAWLGGAVLILGVIAIVIGALSGRPDDGVGPSPTGKPSSSATPSRPGDGGDVVDASVTEVGWVAEPITTDPDPYVRRALEAASTFDTRLAGRDEWLIYLDSWFTPDTRYTSEDDQVQAMETAQLELRQSVVLPEDEWDSLALEDGRVTASTDGEISYVAVPEDSSGDMRIGTADVTLTFTRVDGEGVEYEYDEQVRVSVQVLCGEGSVSTPDSAQRAGDCKVVRYFPEPMEP